MVNRVPIALATAATAAAATSANSRRFGLTGPAPNCGLRPARSVSQARLPDDMLTTLLAIRKASSAEASSFAALALAASGSDVSAAGPAEAEAAGRDPCAATGAGAAIGSLWATEASPVAASAMREPASLPVGSSCCAVTVKFSKWI
jgi:hypothetical protein